MKREELCLLDIRGLYIIILLLYINPGTLCARREKLYEHIYIETATHTRTQALACFILLESVFLTLPILVIESQVHIGSNDHVRYVEVDNRLRVSG